MEKYIVDILTPDKVVAKNIEAQNISVSTVKGEVNVLANHTHFITNLLTGLLIVRNGSDVKHFSVEKGICKILGNKITILSSSTLSKGEVDVGATSTEVEEIKSTLNKTDLMTDDAINSLYNRLEVLDSHLRLSNL